MNILSPSILSADFCKLGEQIKEVELAGARYLHIDVMDGIFVPSISYGMPVIKSIRKCSDIFFDVHLMIDRPERYLKEFAESGADLINFHLEATADVKGTIARIRRLGKKVGITIKPATPAQAVEPYLEFSAGICKDAGYQAVAGQIEVLGKLSVMFAGLPILFAVIDQIQNFL